MLYHYKPDHLYVHLLWYTVTCIQCIHGRSTHVPLYNTPCHIVPSSRVRSWWHPWWHFSISLLLWCPVLIRSPCPKLLSSAFIPLSILVWYNTHKYQMSTSEISYVNYFCIILMFQVYYIKIWYSMSTYNAIIALLLHAICDVFQSPPFSHASFIVRTRIRHKLPIHSFAFNTPMTFRRLELAVHSSHKHAGRDGNGRIMWV